MKKNRQHLVCKNCRKDFTVTVSELFRRGYHRIYCSRKCFHSDPFRKMRPSNPHLKTCPFCRKDFKTEEKKVKYCSVPCYRNDFKDKGLFSGANNPQWRGGVTPKNHEWRTSPEYKAWRTAVLERDGYACKVCGLKSEKGNFNLLHADHIKPYYLFPELGLSIDNGRAICTECHKKTPTWGWKVYHLTRESYEALYNS